MKELLPQLNALSQILDPGDDLITRAAIILDGNVAPDDLAALTIELLDDLEKLQQIRDLLELGCAARTAMVRRLVGTKLGDT